MKVLITGGAGYVGSALCERLATEKDVEEVIIYDNLSRANYNLFLGNQQLAGKVRFVEGDVLDSRTLRKVVRDVDVVYHLAAKVTTPFADENPHLFEQVNHWGTAEVCYAVEESTAAKLVYLSSVSVYGAGTDPKTISTELNPRTFYGISKMRGEGHVLRLSGKKDVHVVRCGNVYGYHPSMRFDAVINKFMFEANFKKKINIHGDGQQHRAFIHISQAIDALAGIRNASDAPKISNLVEHNFRVMDIAEVIQSIVPELEMIFINHNIKLRELRVESEEASEADKALLKARLMSFREQLSF